MSTSSDAKDSKESDECNTAVSCDNNGNNTRASIQYKIQELELQLQFEQEDLLNQLNAKDKEIE